MEHGFSLDEREVPLYKVSGYSFIVFFVFFVAQIEKSIAKRTQNTTNRAPKFIECVVRCG